MSDDQQGGTRGHDEEAIRRAANEGDAGALGESLSSSYDGITTKGAKDSDKTSGSNRDNRGDKTAAGTGKQDVSGAYTGSPAERNDMTGRYTGPGTSNTGTGGYSGTNATETMNRDTDRSRGDTRVGPMGGTNAAASGATGESNMVGASPAISGKRDAMGGQLAGGTQGSVGGLGRSVTGDEQGAGGSGAITTGDESDLGGSGRAGTSGDSGYGPMGAGGAGNMGSTTPAGADTLRGGGTSSMDDDDAASDPRGAMGGTVNEGNTLNDRTKGAGGSLSDKGRAPGK